MSSAEYHSIIAFIGLGAMGKPMVANLAANLVRRGIVIRAYDIADGPAQELQTNFPDVIREASSAKTAVSDAVSAI